MGLEREANPSDLGLVRVEMWPVPGNKIELVLVGLDGKRERLPDAQPLVIARKRADSLAFSLGGVVVNCQRPPEPWSRTGRAATTQVYEEIGSVRGPRGLP